MEAEPVQFLWRHYEERLEPARRELARFVGARPGDLVFVTNATCGVNAVVRSLKLRRGDEVLTTNLDYNACRNALVEVVYGRAASWWSLTCLSRCSRPTRLSPPFCNP